MAKSLKEDTISGLIWNSFDRFGQQAIFAITGIVLARILPVEDFGLVGLLGIFTVIATSIVDNGLGTALVRENNVKAVDYSTMFVFNIVVSLVVYFTLFLSAPLIAAFYKQPSLVLYARIIFLAVPINALGIVQYIKLLKSFSFKITARINLLSLFLSNILAIMMAIGGYGVWALVLQSVLYYAFRTPLLWLWGKWQVSLLFQVQSLKKYLSFSLSFMLSNLINKLFSQAYTSTIGKYFPLNQTGYYGQASKYADMTNQLISSIIQGTTLNTLPLIQDDKDRFLNAARKTVRALSFFLFPAVIGSICVAKPTFILVLTNKWENSIPYFQLLCIAGLLVALSDINVNFLNIKKRSDISLKLELIKIVLALASLAVTIRYGMTAIITGQIIVRLLCYMIISTFSKKIIGYTFLLQFKDIIPYATLSLVMGGVMMSVTFFVKGYILLLISQLTVGILSYFLLNYLLGSKILREIIGLIREKLSPK